MNLRYFIGVLVLAVGAVLGVFVGYVVLKPYFDPELPTPDPAQVSWKTYSNDRIGFALDVPSDFSPQGDGDEVFFRFDGSGLLRIDWLEEETARGRGLWPKHAPVGEIVLGSRPGRKYVYNHFDAISGVRTHAWVVPHRGRYLALEIRTHRVSILQDLGIGDGTKAEPSELNRRIVESFRFLDQPLTD